MRVCDHCKKPIPLGTSNIIRVTFEGKYGELAMKMFGTTNLDFDSLECFGDFRVKKLEKILNERR